MANIFEDLFQSPSAKCKNESKDNPLNEHIAKCNEQMKEQNR